MTNDAIEQNRRGFLQATGGCRGNSHGWERAQDVLRRAQQGDAVLAPVKHNGRSRVYRVLFASRSAFDGCRKVDGVSHANVAVA